MKKWIIIISLMATICLSVFMFTVARHIDSGYIISVTENDVWLVRGSEENIQGKTEEELNEIYKFKGTIYKTKWIPSFIKERLRVGQKVRVFSDGIGDASAPGEDEAAFLFIIK